jgi:copper(I)-binding protein
MSRFHLAFAVATMQLCGVAGASGSADSITISDAYVRQAPPGSPATGAFMVLHNSGSKLVKLIKADNPVSQLTELHTHLHEGGMMKMRPVKDIPIPAGGEARLQPGGLHIMLIDMKAPLLDGDQLPLTLSFDDGSSKVIKLPVKKPTL